MDLEKLRHWLELAQKFHGKDFWADVFDQNNAKQFIGGDFPFVNEKKESSNQADFPQADILQNLREIIVLINLPGVDKEDVQLSITENCLYIKGIVKPLYSEMTGIRSERFVGEFERMIKLPENSIATKISAKFINGVLEVHIPRLQKPKEMIKID